MVMFREQDIRNFVYLNRYSLKLHSITWISFFESLNSDAHAVQIYIFQKKSIKCNKVTKHSKKIQKCAKFEHDVPGM